MTAERRRELPELPPLEGIRRVHVIGMCGTAMGTLAAMFRERGMEVTGSDAMAYPPMSDWLLARGLPIPPGGYRAENVPARCDLVVVGNVARRDNPESVAAHARGLPCLSLPEALRVFFFGEQPTLVVTGTHGKTTTSSIAAWLLHQAELDPSFFIGGVTQNFGSNYRLGAGPFVVEGDEYDTAWFDKVPKFWHYPATSATINNVEYDHADIYPDVASVEHVFRRFAEERPRAGELWVHGADARAMAVAKGTPAALRTFGLGREYDLGAEVLEVGEEGQRVRLFEGGAEVGEAWLPLGGRYNVLNFLAAAGLVRLQGPDLAQCATLVEGFRSVRKRLEVCGEAAGALVIDDFAHHPTAVGETIRALRERYPGRRLRVLFEVKSNTSRRAVFQNAYVDAFAGADEVWFTRPFQKEDGLREEERLSLPQLSADLRARGVRVGFEEEIEALAQAVAGSAAEGDVIAGLSGGDFGGVHGRILALLRGGES